MNDGITGSNGTEAAMDGNQLKAVLHPATGGVAMNVCPGDVLLQVLVGTPA